MFLLCLLALSCGDDVTLSPLDDAPLPEQPCLGLEVRTITVLDLAQDGVELQLAGWDHVADRGHAVFHVDGRLTRTLHAGESELGVELYVVRRAERGWIADYCRGDRE